MFGDCDIWPREVKNPYANMNFILRLQVQEDPRFKKTIIKESHFYVMSQTSTDAAS